MNDAPTAIEDRGEQVAAKAETPLAYRIVRGSLWVAGTSYFNLAFGFLVNIILAHTLDPSDFGVFALAQFLFAVINLRPKTGIGSAFAQRKDTTGEVIGTHLTLDVTAGLLSLCIAIVAIPVLRLFYSWDIVWVVFALALIGVSDSFMGTAWIVMDKLLHFRLTSVISSLAFFLSYAPALWLAFHHGRYWALVAQNGTYAVLLLGGVWWMARRDVADMWSMRWRFDPRVARQLLRFGAPIGATTVTGLFAAQFDNFLVGTFVTRTTLGFYTRAYSLAQWPSQLVTGVISQAAFYTYARLQDDRVRLQKTVGMSLWLITTLAVPLSLSIFAAAPDLVRMLYGDRWVPSAVYLRFLVMYSAIGPLLGDAGWLFIAVGRPRLSVQSTLAQAATLIVVGAPLTLRFGVVGTCIAVGVSFIVGMVLTYRYVAQLIDLNLWHYLGIPIVAAAVTLGGYVILDHLIDTTAWPLVIAVLTKMAYASAAYIMIIFGFQPRGTLERAAYVWRLARAKQ